MRTVISISGPTAQADISSENFSLGAARILVERYRVTDQLGITTEADAARYEFGELVYAALAYISGPDIEPEINATQVPASWPFHPETYRGGSDRIEDLVRAGQFIAAEIDRLSYVVDVAKNPGKPLMTPADGGELVPGQSWPPVHRLGEVERRPSVATDPESFDEDARLHRPIEPGTGSDPATWFEGALLEAQHPAFASQYHEGKRILRCHKSRDAGHESHDWVSSHLPVWCPGSDKSDN